MKRPLLPFAVAGAAAGLLLARLDGPAPAWAVGRDTHVASADGAVGGRRSERTRARLRAAEAGTYIAEMLLERDSSLARWPDSTRLRVWVQRAPYLPHWDERFVDDVRTAFIDWQDTGIPVAFYFVRDSSRADVHVTWVDSFREPISGKTRWARDDDWWIVEANISIAIHHNEGEPLDRPAVKAIALHEAGHLLGLDHSADAANIMTPKVRVRELSAADRATVQLLYTLPAGTVR
jgi:hypothetical protein